VERLQISDGVELAVWHLQERQEVLGVAGEQRVAFVAGDGEGEGIEPGGAGLGARGEDGVFGPRLELCINSSPRREELYGVFSQHKEGGIWFAITSIATAPSCTSCARVAMVN
jgi:hypothetical protein